MRRCLLLVLLTSFFGQHQCDLTEYYRMIRKEHFFVSRADTNEAICVVRDQNYFELPTFNLDKLEFPEGVGIVDWSWRSEWQWDKEHFQLDGNTENFLAGDHPFQLLDHGIDQMDNDFYILASNISLWLTGGNSTESNGFLIELDHWNETTRVKDTTMKYCDRMPEETNAECIIVDYKNETNLLDDGNDWMGLRMIIHYDAVSEVRGRRILRSIEFNKRRGYNIYTLIAQWNSTIKLPHNVVFGEFLQLFGKSHKRNAAYSGYGDRITNLDYLSSLEMKRNYTHRNKGKLCVEIIWSKFDNRNGSSQEVVVKNLLTGRVEPVANRKESGRKFTPWSKFSFDELDAGNYEIRVRFSGRPPRKIDLCNGGNIFKTWRQVPKTLAKCQFSWGWDLGTDEFSVGPSPTIKPDLNPDWRLDDWENVCDRLGIGSNDTHVAIKLCNFYECNFSKCPHLQAFQIDEKNFFSRTWTLISSWF